MGMLRYQDNGRSRKKREAQKSVKQRREETEAKALFDQMNDKWKKARFSSKPLVKGETSLSLPKLEVPKTKVKPGVTVNRGAQVSPLTAKSAQQVGALKDVPKYTGDKVLGVALMHKSNYAPIFSEQEAIEVSKMRRD